MASGRPRRRAHPVSLPVGSLLAEAVRAFGGTLDLDRLLGRLTALSQARLAADAAGAWLLESGDSQLVLHRDLGFNRPDLVARLAPPPGHDMLGWIVSRPGPAVVRGLAAAANPQARGWIEAEEFRSFLGIPLVGDAAPLGMLGLFRRGRRAFTAADLALAEALCMPAGPAIQAARLYEDAQRALSDLRVMQRRLVQGETLRALGELASGTAHHLNNLLTIVVGRVQLLRRSVLEERVAGPLEIVERAARDSAEVVRRLQQFAGMQRTLEVGTVDLNRIVSEVLETTRSYLQDPPRAAGTGITVESRLGPLPVIPGDAAALREMLTGLVLNAIDALPHGGRLAVETSVADSAATLTVTDDGLGMSEAVRQRAHEPFFTTKGARATGLGLSVAFGISRRHGGDLTLQSEQAEGTTVRVTLPLTAELPPPAAVAALPRRPLRILLVDDEEDVRRALGAMFAAQGHTVVPAGGGSEALQRLEADTAFDLVVTDLVMPSMSGWELAAAVKVRWPSLPVGVVSAWGALPGATPGEQASVDFVLSKPVTLDALGHALGRLQGGER